jgi:Hydrazine synthase alpha subunit middle domain
VKHLLPFALVVLLFNMPVAQTAPNADETPVLLYTAAKRYEPLAWMNGKERFPEGAKIFIRQNGNRLLVPDFSASADPAIFFDGTRALFSGKKRDRDHWQVWELVLSTGTLTRITSCIGDCIRPFYLPDNRVVFAEVARRATTINAASLSGRETTRLTYSPGNSLPTDVLRDGRILFEAAFPLDSGKAPELYTVYSDGSGVESYRCDHGIARHSGKQQQSSDIVFVTDRGLGRFTSSLAHQLDVALPLLAGVAEVADLENNDWLISARSKQTGHFTISRWTPGSRDVQSIVSDYQSDVVQPTLVRAHSIPNRHPSGLHDWNYANLLCLNAYTSKFHIPNDAIASVRLYTRNASGKDALLGSTAVEHDGSFYLRTPADQPLKLELLDRQGKTLKKEAGWFWLRRGEQRICVGCHAGPETAPENAVPAVLLRSTVAADMTRTAADSASGGH